MGGGIPAFPVTAGIGALIAEVPGLSNRLELGVLGNFARLRNVFLFATVTNIVWQLVLSA